MRRVAQTVFFLVLVFAAGSTVGLAQARPPLMQSVDVHIPVPPTPVTITGKRHLAYELHITNLRPIDVALTRVAVKDAGRGLVLADYRDSGLTNSIGRLNFGNVQGSLAIVSNTGFTNAQARAFANARVVGGQVSISLNQP